MNKAFLVCLLFIFLFLRTSAQKFYLNDSIPVSAYNRTLQIPWAGGINFPQWSEIDLNQDGKPDLFMFDRSNNRVITLLNDGIAGTNSYHHAPEYAKQFPQLDGWAYLYDYNCDGLPDLFTVFKNKGILQYKSSYNNSTGWSFQVVDTSISADYGGGSKSNITASQYITPHFNDIDGDGDMDILSQQFICTGTYAYFRNMSMEHYGVCDSLSDYKWETNSWGKFALCAGNTDFIKVCACNINCSAPYKPESVLSDYEPQWDQSNAAPKDDTYSMIFTLDLDGDGDKDVLIGDSQCRNILRLFNNGSPTDATIDCATQDTLFPSYDAPALLRYFTGCSYVDVDNDGRKDLLVGNSEWENKKGVLFYKNNGTNAAPVFSYRNDSLFQSEMIDVGEGAAPVFFDADNDGLLDLIIGNVRLTEGGQQRTGLTLFRNTGSKSKPSFEFVTDNYANVNSLFIPGPLTPAFADLDGDGDADMLLGKGDGKLCYFTNIALSPTDPADFQFVTPNYMNIDIGNASTPQLYDLSGDGKPDLIIGEQNGLLNYFENTGTTVASFTQNPTIDTLGKILQRPPAYTDGYTSPFFFKYNGSTRLVCSDMRGYLILYDSIDGNLTGAFRKIDTLFKGQLGNRYGYNISVSGADINNDGFTDLVIGLYGGGVQIYCEDDFNIILADAKPVFSFDLYPNPANEELNIRLNHFRDGKDYAVAVYNAMGSCVHSSSFASPSYSLGTSGFANGVYLVRVSADDRTITSKLIVNH